MEYGTLTDLFSVGIEWHIPIDSTPQLVNSFVEGLAYVNSKKGGPILGRSEHCLHAFMHDFSLCSAFSDMPFLDPSFRRIL